MTTRRASSKASKSSAVVAELCLYGRSGAGYIARTADGRMFGDGEPVEGRTFTAAIFMAVEDLKDAGVTSGQLAIFAPGGQSVAVVELAGRVPFFGDLPWTVAPVLELSAAALLEASTPATL